MVIPTFKRTTPLLYARSISDPIMVQSCVCCLFWTNRHRMAVTSIFLSSSLSRDKSLYRRGAISKWKYLLLLKLKCHKQPFLIPYWLSLYRRKGGMIFAVFTIFKINMVFEPFYAFFQDPMHFNAFYNCYFQMTKFYVNIYKPWAGYRPVV